ncbi:hypothetical protein CH259_12120 [Rhodococcus sp. 05-2254-4]|nr:hypothetical protein CH259_12120 [Rhodococcus sp. 05-2254-4]OZE40718.1 hypothetical protein CH261_27085 [Rhodococcus sp. 05-2254-3]OZE45709.1 hypothetical protein CH283_25740 [Rhodococcus sp. 05-2254-2]
MGCHAVTTPVRLAVRNLTVSYGQHEVVHGIDFDVERGSIVSLLGANGSGKSTTVKALTGVNPLHAKSQVTFNDNPIRAKDLTPVAARKIGIRVVHQESPLIANMTVAEMTALHTGFPLVGATFVQRRALARKTEGILREFDVAVHPNTLCADLTAGERALVSLVISMAGISPERALLVLDETTAPLSTREAARLLDRVRGVADRGLSVLMVTHRLPEVREYSDRTIVLRDGHLVSNIGADEFSEADVIHAMVGGAGHSASSHDHDHDRSRGRGRPALVVENLAGNVSRELSLAVGTGEILGVTGRSGEGASELLRLIGGVESTHVGTTKIDGNDAPITGARDAIRAGIFYLSLDRLNEGGIALMTVHDNVVLPRVERYGANRRRAASDVDRMIRELDIRPADPTVPYASLSGGNQQKVLLARWLLLEPRILLLDDPAVGVDPNTREIIFDTLRELAARGTTVIIRSSEPEHLVRLCDRVIVVNGGRIVEELTDLNLEDISRATYA